MEKEPQIIFLQESCSCIFFIISTKLQQLPKIEKLTMFRAYLGLVMSAYFAKAVK
jgi:hypothetical protein